MPAEPRPIPEVHGLDPLQLDPALLRSTTPLVLRGLVRDWPLARAGAQSAQAAAQYLRRFDRGEAVVAQVGPPEIAGRFFYNADMSGFNFRPERVPLAVVLETLLRDLEVAQPPAIYVGSTTLDTYLPGLRADNPITLPQAEPLASIWIGNRTRIAAHQDLPDNLACVVAGRRRFTLFPPEQLANLYIGPLDLTPAGQPVSLVDITAPDLERFRAMRRRWSTHWWPTWNRAMRCSCPACGGTTSRHWTASTCWSISGGGKVRPTWIRQ